MALHYYSNWRPYMGVINMLEEDDSLLNWWFYPDKFYHSDIWVDSNGGGKKSEKVNVQKGDTKPAKVDSEGKVQDKGGSADGKGEKGKGKGNEQKPDNKGPKIMELQVNLCCEACGHRVKKKIMKLEEVQTVVVDVLEKRVVVKGTAKPEAVLKQAQKVRSAVMWPQKK